MFKKALAFRCAAAAWMLMSATHGLAQTFAEFPVGAGAIGGIAAGRDGNLWFTETGARKIGRITVTGQITEFTIPALAQPGRITAGADGNLWFAEAAGFIGRMTVTGKLTEFPLPYSPFEAVPFCITAGPDGNLWFTMTISRVGRVTVQGVFKEFETGYNGLGGITAGPDGNLWFTTYAGAAYESKICRVTPEGVITQFETLPLLSPEEIVSGPDGNLWVLQNSPDIVRFAADGKVLGQFNIGVNARSIGTWNDGNVWIGSDREICSITPSGVVVHRYSLPPGAAPVIALTEGPDGNLWFVEELGTIGRLTIPRGRRRSIQH